MLHCQMHPLLQKLIPALALALALASIPAQAQGFETLDIGAAREHQIGACKTAEDWDQMRWSSNPEWGDKHAVPGCINVWPHDILRHYKDGDAPMIELRDGNKLHLDNTPAASEIDQVKTLKAPAPVAKHEKTMDERLCEAADVMNEIGRRTGRARTDYDCHSSSDRHFLWPLAFSLRD